MYQINPTTYAIEEGDRIKFVRDGGGLLNVEGGSEESLKISTKLTLKVVAQVEAIRLEVARGS